MASMKPYMVIFKDDAPASVIEGEISKVKAQGGEIKQRFDSEMLKGFAATLPDNLATAYSSLQAKGGDSHFAYIEPDTEVHTMENPSLQK